MKDPADEQADLWRAYRQLQDYKEHVPALFTYNKLMVISDGDITRVGSLTAGSDRFAPWRSIEDAARPGEPTLEALATVTIHSFTSRYSGYPNRARSG